MEGMLHGNDLMVCSSVLQISILSCCLNGSFNRLCPAVCEKHSVHPGNLFQLFGSFNSRYIIIIIGSMDHLVDLLFQGIIVNLISIAKGKYSYPCTEIQIFLSFHVIKVNTFSLIQHHLKTVIRMKECCLCILYIILH